MNEMFPDKYENFRLDKPKSFSQAYQELSQEYPAISMLFLAGSICLLFAFVNEIIFHTKYAVQPIYYKTEQIIDSKKEPIQIEPSSSQPFNFTANNKERYTVIPMADYDISGMVVAKNTNVWLRGLMNSSFDNIALIDFGLLSGEVADEETLKHVRFQSKKILNSARELRPMPKQGNSWNDVIRYFQSKNISLEYFAHHMSHIHVIPANDNVMSALIKLKKKDIVRFEGYLVDMEYENGSRSKTSLSRSDTDSTSRGNGACETMYVKSVQLKNKIYK